MATVDSREDGAESQALRIGRARTRCEELIDGAAAHKSRDFGRGVAHAAREVLAALGLPNDHVHDWQPYEDTTAYEVCGTAGCGTERSTGVPVGDGAA